MSATLLVYSVCVVPVQLSIWCSKSSRCSNYHHKCSTHSNRSSNNNRNKNNNNDNNNKTKIAAATTTTPTPAAAATPI